MLDIKFIRENIELVKQNNLRRMVKVDVNAVLKLDDERRGLIHEIDELRRARKSGSKGKPSDEDIVRLKKVGDEIQTKEGELKRLEAEYFAALGKVPNITHPETPVGGEESFKVLETHGEPPKFDFQAKGHEELMTASGLLDFERGAKVAGAKWYFTMGDLVKLNISLVNYGIEVATKRGYELMETPDAAKNKILEGIGFEPRGVETQVYSIENSDLSLIGTAEITVGGYHADEILDLSKGAKKYVALSHCFRTEAGAYGKESSGLYRVHQFTKLEMFVFCMPEDSEQMHSELLATEKEICDGLEIPYRVIDVASGDLGGPAYRKFDIEAWMPMRNDYGEITSTSNCTDYQARRLNIKYRKPDGTTEFVHTLNGTAVVTSRFPIAIFENHQQADGTIKYPKCLNLN